jgi:hypothetical protein
MELTKANSTPTFTDYIDSKGKRLIYSRFMESVGVGFRGDVLGLPGPNMPDYYKPLASILVGKGKLYGYEIDPWTAELQKKHLYYMPEKDKIILHQGNIMNAEPRDMIDLDLIHTWKRDEVLINHLFQKQFNMVTGQKKVFIVNVATHGSTLGETLAYCNDMLRTDIGVLHTGVSILNGGHPLIDCNGEPVGRKYTLNGNSKQFSVELYTYRDKATMANFLIQYI